MSRVDPVAPTEFRADHNFKSEITQIGKVEHLTINNYGLEKKTGSRANAEEFLMDFVGVWKVTSHTAIGRLGKRRDLAGSVTVSEGQKGLLYIEGKLVCEIERKTGAIQRFEVNIPRTLISKDSTTDADGMDFHIPADFVGRLDGRVENASEARGVFWKKGSANAGIADNTLSIEPICREMPDGEFRFFKVSR